MAWMMCLASCLLALTSSRVISSCRPGSVGPATILYRRSPLSAALITVQQHQQRHHSYRGEQEQGHRRYLPLFVPGRSVGSRSGPARLRNIQRTNYCPHNGNRELARSPTHQQHRTVRLDFCTPQTPTSTSCLHRRRHRRHRFADRRPASGGGRVKPTMTTGEGKTRAAKTSTEVPLPARRWFWAGPLRSTNASSSVAAFETSQNMAATRGGGGRSTPENMVGRRRAAAAKAVAAVKPGRSKRPPHQAQSAAGAVSRKLSRAENAKSCLSLQGDDDVDDRRNHRDSDSRTVASPPLFLRRSTRGTPLLSMKAGRASPRDAPFRSPGVVAFLNSAWRRFVYLERLCEASWVGKASAHVFAGALASSHSAVAGLVVGLALWVSCAKRLTGSKGDWKQVARITIEVAVLWYCHALPHGLGAGRPLRGNFGTGKAGDLLGAMWHFLGQGAFVRLVAASGRVVHLNVLEANGILLGISQLGNAVAGSRMRRVVGGMGVTAAASTAMAAMTSTEAQTYQLRGFFSRTRGIFGEMPILSLPFDSADTFLALQGILSATEREVVRKNGVLASAFRDFAGKAANTLDAHSLGAVGARNLMGMGFITARVRMFGRPALSLGWTEKANNMCMVGDPICGSLLQKLLDPTCVMLKGRGHWYDAYIRCVGCLANQ